MLQDTTSSLRQSPSTPEPTRRTKLVRLQANGLLDIPKELIASIVGYLPYASLPAFRTTCKLAKELVDAASNGWVMKVDEGEALQTSNLLQRLTSLCYMWFESWTWEDDQEASFLAVVLTNLSVFARLQEVRFPGTQHIPLRCLRGLLAALPNVTSLSLPPLPPDVPTDSPSQLTAFTSMAALTALTDLSLDGWALSDAAARTLSAGLPRIRRLTLGDTTGLSRMGYEALARLKGLVSLSAVGVRGNNRTVEPLTGLTALTGIRFELGAGYGDEDTGPLAQLPELKILGWWHPEPLPPQGLRPGSLSVALRELSLCMELDQQALAVLSACGALSMLQVQSIALPTAEASPRPRPLPAPGSPSASAPTSTSASTSAALSASAASAGGSVALPVLSSVRTLILGELSLPPASEPQPVARLAAVFPLVENLLTFHVTSRGLLQLDKAARLRRLVLHCQRLRDEALEFMPSLPTLAGLQFECCHQLSEAAARALRSTPCLEQLLLLDTPAVSDVFLTEAVSHLRSLRTLVLFRLPNVHDEGLQSLTALAGSLEQVEVRGMPSLTPAGLQVVHRLSRVTLVAVCECAGLDKAACRVLEAGLMAAGRDVTVEHEATCLVPVSLADDFPDPPSA